MLFLFAADRGVAVEYWALQHMIGFFFVLGAITAAAVWAHRRTTGFSNAPGNRIQFEDVAPSEISALDLRQDGAWSNDDAYVNAINTGSGWKRRKDGAELDSRPTPTLIGLNLNQPPQAPVEASPVHIQVQFEQLMEDFRHAAQVFRRYPALSAITVLFIALGLGANLTIYSIIRSVLSKPASAVQADGLVMFGQSIDGQLVDGGPLNSYPNYVDLAARTKTMSALTASVAAPWLTLTLHDGTL